MMRRLREMNRRESVMAVVTAAAIMLGGFYVGVAEPLTYRWMAVHRKAENNANELGKLRHLLANRNEIEPKYERIKGAVLQSSSGEETQLELMKEIESIARSSGVRIRSMKPVGVKPEGFFERYGVQLNVECESGQFVNLLHRMQEPGHLLSAELISLKAGRGRLPLSVGLTVTKLARRGTE